MIMDINIYIFFVIPATISKATTGGEVRPQHFNQCAIILFISWNPTYHNNH